MLLLLLLFLYFILFIVFFIILILLFILLLITLFLSFSTFMWFFSVIIFFFKYLSLVAYSMSEWMSKHTTSSYICVCYQYKMLLILTICCFIYLFLSKLPSFVSVLLCLSIPLYTHESVNMYVCVCAYNICFDRSINQLAWCSLCLFLCVLIESFFWFEKGEEKEEEDKKVSIYFCVCCWVNCVYYVTWASPQRDLEVPIQLLFLIAN